jgi:hypothetical protein
MDGKGYGSSDGGRANGAKAGPKKGKQSLGIARAIWSWSGKEAAAVGGLFLFDFNFFLISISSSAPQATWKPITNIFSQLIPSSAGQGPSDGNLSMRARLC